ncbi:BspA family leucine-rich repeat surface protein [Rhodohalobacter sp. 8-1]|uniref:BspA family leucine-rich repeat surface protein n=1 Tax=Rhodohalobacter sp. 8-1 TaxID=3131972 RepID=UPI0030EC90F9
MNTLIRFFIITVLITTLSQIASAQTQYSDVTIEEARGLALGTDVRIKGIVTRANGRFSHIQDGDAAISTFQGSGEYNDAIGSGDVAPGDSIVIVGVTDEFNSLFQLSSITDHTVTSRGNPLPEPAEITLGDVGESYESELIMISGLSIDTDDAQFQGNTTYSLLENGTPNSNVTMRVVGNGDTELIGESIPDVFTFTGVLGQFSTSGDDGYQLVPRNVNDVLNEQMSEAFELAANGVTIICDAAAVGESGTVNSVTYTKRTKEQVTTSNAATTCTSGITDMSSLFELEFDFNEDISSWDVSDVTDMSLMFAGDAENMTSFNQDIGNWDVSKVTNMNRMFRMTDFNQDIGDWDVSNVTNTFNMFASFDENQPHPFNQDIGDWDVSSVTRMGQMFLNAQNFNQDISAWDVSSVETMISMFNGATSFNQDISSWNVSNVINMAFMFTNAVEFNQEIGNWDVSNVTLMGGMFDGAVKFNGYIGDWDVSNVTRMGQMFSGAKNFNQDISNWDVSEVFVMNSMFADTDAFNQDIGGWDVSKVEFMIGMFNDATAFNQDLSGWCVELITSKPDDFDTESGFVGEPEKQPVWGTCPFVPIDNPDFKLAENGVTVECDSADVGEVGSVGAVTYTKRRKDQITTENAATTCTSGITDMRSLFREKSNFNEDIGSWDVSSVTTMNSMFDRASSYDQDISNWDVSAVTTMRYMFREAYSFNQDLNTWNVGNVTNMGGMFSFASDFNGDIENWEVTNVIDMSSMFWNATSFNQNIGGWDVGQVTDMLFMFSSASVFNQDIGSWDVSAVTTMSSMFRGASAFNRSMDEWDVSQVQNMSNMFNNAVAFNQDIGGWDVSQVTDMSGMLQGATEFDQDIGNWNVGNVTDMGAMFSNASAFNQDIGGWDVSKVTDMGNLFYYSSAFDQNIGDWDVSQVTRMRAMFYNASVFNQDISGWDVSQVTNMNLMFVNSSAFNQDLSGWCVELIDTQPDRFDTDSGFFGQVEIQPQWGTCPSVPAAISLINPMDESVDVKARPIFEWNGSDGAESYHIQVSIDEGFSSLEIDSSGISGTAFEPLDDLESMTDYYWRVQAENGSGVSGWSDIYTFRTGMATSIDDDAGVPTEFSLAQNYPNPFNPSAVIEFGLPEAAEVRLDVYNMLGQRIATLVNEQRAAGRHQVQFNASKLSSGTYIYRIQAGEFLQTRKMMLIK